MLKCDICGKEADCEVIKTIVEHISYEEKNYIICEDCAKELFEHFQERIWFYKTKSADLVDQIMRSVKK